MDGRKKRGGKTKKQKLREYLESNDIQEFCVHTLLNHANDGKGLPIKETTMRNYLYDFVGEGIIQDTNKQTCPDSPKKRHKHYEYVPKENREKVLKEYRSIQNLSEKISQKEVSKMPIEEEPTRENVFQAITTRYSVGDTFTSPRIRNLWPEEQRNKVSGRLYQLANSTDLLDFDGKTKRNKQSVNIYKLKTEKYQEEGPYGCDECGKTFDTKQGLNIHTTRMHESEETEETEEEAEEEKEYECDECGATFDTKQGLGGHVARHHKVEGEEATEVEEEEKEAEEVEEEVPEGGELSVEIKGGDVDDIIAMGEDTYQRKRNLLVLEILNKILE